MSTRASPEKDLRKYVKQELKKIIDRRPEFKNCLIQRGVYGIYVSTAAKYLAENNSDCIEDRLCYIAESSCPINESMCWRYTKQGHSYWSRINDVGYLSDGYMRKKQLL